MVGETEVEVDVKKFDREDRGGFGRGSSFSPFFCTRCSKMRIFVSCYFEIIKRTFREFDFFLYNNS